ncbi:dephospho-CoA kinase [Oceanisphaera avium]|uniref:Dephospho-CoA kinase n=1 Tax=Oceanisphaera avium TaxID=1903694 RepID=A0A1Y0CZW5_9GAMM|nr:dephospho-CoA kinase [Oceanisphaera avium]ART80880.1 dephospho-CoA kinase [Oceanisphaera avium]
MTYIVGVTGGIGCGKSTVAELFAEQGIVVIDADIIAREVVAPGEPVLDAIGAYFGYEVIKKDGSLDRALMRERIFKSDGHRHWLEALLHPLIRERMIKECQNARSAYCLLVVPLLVENHLTDLCHRVLVIDASEQTQIARTVARDNSSVAQVKAIIATQATREQRLQAADDVLNNDQSDIAQLQAEVLQLHAHYLARAGA